MAKKTIKFKGIEWEISRLEDLNELDAVIEAINKQKRKAEMFGYKICSITFKREFFNRCMIMWERRCLCSLNEPIEILGLCIEVEDELNCDFTINNNKNDGWDRIRFWFSLAGAKQRIKELKACGHVLKAVEE